MGALGHSRANLAATEHPTVKDIYWAAGVFEGEGCAYRDVRKGKYDVPFAIMGQKDKWVLERFKALFGGSIGVAKHKAYKDTYQWRVCGTHARGFLMTVYSLMSPRRKEQIKFALGLRDNPSKYEPSSLKE